MTAASYRAPNTAPRPSQTPPYIELVWSASHAESVPQRLVREAHAHGASAEAESATKAVGMLSRQLATRASLAERAVSDFRALLCLIDDEPIEDGVTHQGEKLLADFLREHGASSLLPLMARTDNSRAAVLLRLLGRDETLDSKAHSAFLSKGLNSSSVEVRDAAAQAAELWDDPATLRALRAHHEPTPWLDAYIRQVAEGITSRAGR